jgi:UDP-N-acetylmuramate dehydrogenase
MNMAEPGLRGRLLEREPMRKHTSWRVGGPADRVYIPADLKDFATFLRMAQRNEAVHVVGLGSNLLVRDGGIRGTLVFTHGALKTLRAGNSEASVFALPSATIYAEAGVASPVVARVAARNAFVGGEFLAGIPGTVGGALRMNAGCYGRETWEVVERVLTIDRKGRFTERTPEDYAIGYRSVSPTAGDKELSDAKEVAAAERLHPSCLMPPPSEEFFAAAWFRFARGDREASMRKIRELLAKRIASQPLNMPNAGSVFRNPPGDHSARLIEACGLKEARIGDAMVSARHANFIVNCGQASARDIENLIEKVHQTVLAETGVDLVREVEIVGEHA